MSESLEKVRNPFSEKTTLKLRDVTTGMFRSRKSLAPTKAEAALAITEKLTDVDDQGNSLLEKVLDNLVLNATTSAAQCVYDKLGNLILGADGKPLLVVCPKTMMAISKNADTLLRAAGLDKPEKAEARGHDIKIVMVMPGENMLFPEVRPYEAHSAPQPAWIEGEFTETNEPHTPQPVPQAPVGRTQSVTKDVVLTAWLESLNQAAVTSITAGLTIAAVRERASKETLPMRMTSQGHVTQGLLHLADALARCAETVVVEVEQEE
jgi:hypothetical protein